ncbi:hypothetical protein KGF57_003464 [Candida theae]|uniref:NAD-dependent epimerase/dehydratase domain-containing protein n=1 Tax=Candida theae TaxID=1198502 RepID=A0AAD5BD05_9ASCO|nr:uncharacterized protein KGF57_003464 [Candida theae]KAI5955979.1 hypothetical protein KGF57_003464 [Candida theae]
MTISETPETVVITGGTGYVGQHIIAQLLKSGYKVVAIVRSPARGFELIKQFNHPNLQTEAVDQLDKPNSIDFVLRAHKEATIFIAGAAVTDFTAKDVEKEILQKSNAIVKNTLESIHRHGEQIKRVILTSSSGSTIGPEKMFSYDAEYNDDGWSPLPYEAGLANAQMAYFVSKKFNEELAWKYVKENKTQFDLVSINPALCLGPAQFADDVSLVNDGGRLPSTTSFIANLLKLHKNDKVEPLAAGAVDVRDVAKAHVSVINNAKASGQRLVVEGYKFTNANAVNILKENFASLRDKLPDVEPIPASKFVEPDLRRSKAILGIETYYTLNESVVDLAKQLLTE